ncbi:MAG: SGNH/GDSL hydrolase family protein [Verrucomicrobiae bacterium]|nr:SGNH/GDSL hydrolase family protein [Verrucomicrobiae bacterium]
MGEKKHSIRLWALILVAAELALAAFVMVRFELDLAKPLGWDLMWIVPIFVVHAVIPLAWRRAFLLGVTALLLVRILGGTSAMYAIAVGLALIGICHLPIAFRWRVSLVTAIAIGLALAAAHVVHGGHHLEAAIPILGGMFMFRLVLYLYDIRHEKPGAATPLERIGYFFLLPAPLAPFFPALDYQIYRRSWYQKPAFSTYQVGMLWISRGVVHLVLYRVIYHFFSPPTEFVHDLAGVAAFCLSGYLIYLRVSGLFHVITGGLRLFGYELPETHHLYFFAHDFSDYWRRINIYWKDFMTKMVFYPSFMSLRKLKLGHQSRLAVATIIVFIATAVLHAYQTFWLRGDFEIHQTDYAFWGILGLLVVANNLLDARRGPAKRDESKSWSWKKGLSISLRALGLFLLFAVLWALWSAQEWKVFADVMSQAQNAPAWQVLMLAGIGVAVMALGTLGQWIAHHGFNPFEAHPGLKRSVATTVLPLLFFGILWQWHSAVGIPGWLGARFDVVWVDQPNERDQINRERSYYEGLLAGGASVGAEEEKMTKEVVPDIRGVLYQERFGPAEVWGATWTTNRWGMRDKYYSKSKPPGVYRIAMTGASYTAGRGVKDGANFESLLEDQLNADHAGVEILNFATSANCTVQRLADLEMRIVDFHPDALFLICHGGEVDRNLRALARLVEERHEDFTFPFIDDLFEKAGVKRGDRQADTIRKLKPHEDELMSWVYRQIGDVCRAHDITPVWVYLANTRTRSLELAEEARPYAAAAGLVTIVLDDAYGGLPPEKVALSESDSHPNELGHQLVAKRLYEKLVDYRDEIGLPLPPESIQMTKLSKSH